MCAAESPRWTQKLATHCKSTAHVNKNKWVNKAKAGIGEREMQILGTPRPNESESVFSQNSHQLSSTAFWLLFETSYLKRFIRRTALSKPLAGNKILAAGRKPPVSRLTSTSLMFYSAPVHSCSAPFLLDKLNSLLILFPQTPKQLCRSSHIYVLFH